MGTELYQVLLNSKGFGEVDIESKLVPFEIRLNRVRALVPSAPSSSSSLATLKFAPSQLPLLKHLSHYLHRALFLVPSDKDVFRSSSARYREPSLVARFCAEDSLVMRQGNINIPRRSINKHSHRL
jgi:hypothetical protein